MAYVEKRGPNRWRARYRAPDGRERSRTFDRKVDADRWLAGVEVSKASGAWIDPRLGQVGFAAWADRWAATVVDLRSSTLDRDLGLVRNYLVPRFGAIPLAKVSTTSVKAFVADLNRAGELSPATVRKVGQVLAKVMTAAVAEGLIPRSPCEGVKLPAEGRREMVFLAAEQVGELVTATDEHYRTLVATAAYLGLRWGELAGLRT